MEYFIFVSFGLEGLWYVVCGVFNIKRDVLQFNMIFNESVGRRSKLTEVNRLSRDGCTTFLLTATGMNACGEQRSRLDANVFVLLVHHLKQTQFGAASVAVARLSDAWWSSKAGTLGLGLARL